MFAWRACTTKPRQNRFWFDELAYLSPRLWAQCFAFDGQPPALSVRERDPLGPDHLSQYPVLFKHIVELLLKALVQPARDHHDQKLDSCRKHHLTLEAVCRSIKLQKVPKSRDDDFPDSAPDANDFPADERSSQDDLRYVIKEYMSHYLEERFHQGLDGELIQSKSVNDNATTGEIKCQSRLGRLLNFYHREAA